ncbi:Equilibrative nucleoside transporter 3 [Trichoplax sp. H2]|nr:Equilibrative nucleoside transporter 3 [Trichoplax sp. H2]|eukprot:RDD43130.1 Equilibrative nucleoside transporter 3 [Trichoplax sp. H2]
METKPPDRYYIVYFLLLILGITTTLPMHIFYTASTYFSAQLEGTPYQHVIENYMMLAYSLPTIIVGAVNIMLLRRIDVRKRIIFSLSVLIVSFIATTVLAKLNTSNWKYTFFVLTLTIIVLSSTFGGTIYCASLFGLVSIFPKEYSQALIIGNALSGIFTALANIMSLVVTHSARRSGVGYFISGTAILVIAMIIQLVLEKNVFARYYMKAHLEYDVQQKKKLLEDDEAQLSDTDDEDMYVPYGNNKLKRLHYVFMKIWPIALAAFWCNVISFCVFPSVVTRGISIYRKSNTLLTGPLFIPVTCFLMDATADIVGRILSRWILFPRQNQGILLLLISLCRVIFIPLFLYCNIHPRKHLPVKIYSDIAYMVLIMLCGFSHGYITTLCTMYAGKRVPPQFSESAGAIIYYFVTVGIAAGTAASFVAVSIL